MAPVFSRIPVVALPGMHVISGLMCGHENCYALFTNLEDSEEHANSLHDGELRAVTSGIYEHDTDSGKKKLFRVLNGDDGEYDAKMKWMTEKLLTISVRRSHTTIPIIAETHPVGWH
jgi:hypothetical protein